MIALASSAAPWWAEGIAHHSWLAVLILGGFMGGTLALLLRMEEIVLRRQSRRQQNLRALEGRSLSDDQPHSYGSKDLTIYPSAGIEEVGQ